MKELKELQETLIDLGFTVRLDQDGNEVEKPEDYTKYELIEDNKLINEIGIGWSIEELAHGIDKQCEIYNNATEVIKLPNPVEMWRELSRPSLKFDESYHIYDKYMHFIQTPLTKEMFVNEVQKPLRIDYKDEDGNYDEAHWVINNAHYDEKEKEVLFHGWKILKEDGGLLRFVNNENTLVTARFKYKSIKYLQSLSVKLYLKIK